MRIDTDKLKILANNVEDYINCYQHKLIKIANSNGHEMKSFRSVKGFKQFDGEYLDESHAYCLKCPFELWMEHHHINGEDKVYLTDYDEIGDTYKKCTRNGI
jgi:hypothetical protein